VFGAAREDQLDAITGAEVGHFGQRQLAGERRHALGDFVLRQRERSQRLTAAAAPGHADHAELLNHRIFLVRMRT
jgi:hypothetical protein